MLKNAVLYNQEDSQAYLLLGDLYILNKRFSDAQYYLNKAYLINPDNDEIKLKLIDSVSANRSKNFEDYFNITVKYDDRLPYSNITKYHYLRLYDILKKDKIKYYAMQYPTLSIVPIKKFFPEDTKIIFISNEENFKKALINGIYEDYFIDNFALRQPMDSMFHGKFGHATREGNRLIAQNAADAIMIELSLI
jgi:tetratricopeptide (TPR) repeat protein